MSHSLAGRRRASAQVAQARGGAFTGIQYTDPAGRTRIVPLPSSTGDAPVPPFVVLAADPADPIDGTWWVTAIGTSPTRDVELKVRDGGVTTSFLLFTV